MSFLKGLALIFMSVFLLSNNALAAKASPAYIQTIQINADGFDSTSFSFKYITGTGVTKTPQGEFPKYDINFERGKKGSLEIYFRSYSSYGCEYTGTIQYDTSSSFKIQDSQGNFAAKGTDCPKMGWKTTRGECAYSQTETDCFIGISIAPK